MSRPCLARGWAAGRALAGALVGGAALVAGCSSNGSRTQDTALSPMGGSIQEVKLDSTGPRHLVVIVTPTSGWQVAFDRVAGDAVYLTVTRPSPEFLQTQALVEHRIDTTVASGKSLRAMVRTVDFGGRASGEYAQAAKFPN